MISRLKRFLAAAAFLLVLLPLLAQASGMTERGTRFGRSLSFYNTHTQESIDVSYWRGGRYDHGALETINAFLRDHRNGHVHTISPDLLNLLYGIKQELKTRYPQKDITFHVISGYRSPASNEMLRAKGGGQAKNSRHMQGDAIDIRVPGIKTTELRDIAWCFQRGGVGYYKGSDFVHVDTAKVRSWNWTPKAGMCNRGSS